MHVIANECSSIVEKVELCFTVMPVCMHVTDRTVEQ